MRAFAKVGENSAEKRAGLKLLRDRVELQNATLPNIKTHLLGRDETGARMEPPDHYNGNDQVEFERYFHRILTPWTLDDLKLECEDCGRRAEEVASRRFEHQYEAEEYFDLCEKCYEKRMQKIETKTDEQTEPVNAIELPASKGEVRFVSEPKESAGRFEFDLIALASNRASCADPAATM